MTTARTKAIETARKGAASRRQRRDPLVKAEQERRILALWISGESPGAIADAVGLSESTVQRVRKAALQVAMPLRDAKAEELRELELQRLDELQAAHWQVATNPLMFAGGTHKSAGIVLSCIDRRAKMLGLDAPVKVDARVQGALDAEIEQLVAQLEANGLVKLVE